VLRGEPHHLVFQVAAWHTLLGRWTTVGSESRALVYDTLLTAFPHLLGGGLERGTRPDIGVDANSLTSAQLAELMHSSRWQPWTEALGKVHNCAHPIHVTGSSVRVNPATGDVLATYSSRSEPLGVTCLPCGNRRAARCLSCSRVYAADIFQLIRAGVAGGKTVPDRVADNPLVFATFTAPSFGKVHTRRDGNQLCHPTTHGPDVCSHGRSRTCRLRHGQNDALLGQALCLFCYDFTSQVVWQWWVPKLWQRFTVALRRAVARDLGIAATKVHELATIQYAKVAEEQHRGAVHFHALIRLDGPKTADGFATAPEQTNAHRLGELIKAAGGHVRLSVPGVDLEDPERVLAFGRQLDVRVVSASRRSDDTTDGLELSAEQVAGYLGKYATKSAGDDPARVHNSHQSRLKDTTRRLARRAAANPDPAIRKFYRLLGKRADDNAFRGHFCTKSKRFSVTMGALRRARCRAARLIAQANRDPTRLDLAAMEEELLADEAATTITLGDWRYAGTGWATDAETALALAAAAMAREYARSKAAKRDQTHQPRKEIYP
jgi:Replication initiator protein, pSAM2